jgi:hypothetical protein
MQERSDIGKCRFIDDFLPSVASVSSMNRAPNFLGVNCLFAWQILGTMCVHNISIDFPSSRQISKTIRIFDMAKMVIITFWVPRSVRRSKAHLIPEPQHRFEWHSHTGTTEGNEVIVLSRKLQPFREMYL